MILCFLESTVYWKQPPCIEVGVRCTLYPLRPHFVELRCVCCCMVLSFWVSKIGFLLGCCCFLFWIVCHEHMLNSYFFVYSLFLLFLFMAPLSLSFCCSFWELFWFLWIRWNCMTLSFLLLLFNVKIGFLWGFRIVWNLYTFAMWSISLFLFLSWNDYCWSIMCFFFH